jgi:hypothetical protein
LLPASGSRYHAVTRHRCWQRRIDRATRKETLMSQRAEESYEFAVGERPTLIVKNPAGSVTVTAGEAGRITMQVTKTLRGVFMGDNGLETFERVRVTAEQQQEMVRITVHQPSSRVGKHVVTVALALQVPTQCRLDLEVDAGSVEISGVSSVISGRVDAGTVTTRDVTFMDRSEACVDAGTITIEGALGEAASLDVRVDAGSARLTLPQWTDAALDAQVDAGSITIDGWDVEKRREFMSARARGPLIPDARGRLRIKVDAGSIRLQAQH